MKFYDWLRLRLSAVAAETFYGWLRLMNFTAAYGSGSGAYRAPARYRSNPNKNGSFLKLCNLCQLQTFKNGPVLMAQPVFEHMCTMYGKGLLK